MKAFVNYFVMGFSALLPLINPPGSALELLGIVGVGEGKPYRFLARKIAVNTTLFLMAVALAGPYALQFFGISVDVLRLVGGAVLAAMGWDLLNKPGVNRRSTIPDSARLQRIASRAFGSRRCFTRLHSPSRSVPAPLP